MAVDIFMNMKGEKSGVIKGEARDAKHKEEIDVLSFKWGMMAPTDLGSGLRTGRTQVQNFTFEKPIDKSTPILANALLNNEMITKAVFTCRKAGLKGGDPVEFTVAQFRDVTGSTRKHALPLAAELDARGVTRRRDDLRIEGPKLPNGTT